MAWHAEIFCVVPFHFIFLPWRRQKDTLLCLLAIITFRLQGNTLAANDQPQVFSLALPPAAGGRGGGTRPHLLPGISAAPKPGWVGEAGWEVGPRCTRVDRRCSRGTPLIQEDDTGSGGHRGHEVWGWGQFIPEVGPPSLSPAGEEEGSLVRLRADHREGLRWALGPSSGPPPQPWEALSGALGDQGQHSQQPLTTQSIHRPRLYHKAQVSHRKAHR